MGTLKQRLERIKAGFAAQAPEEALATVARANESLLASGILERIPEAGQRLPEFELPASYDEPVYSGDLLADGPLVISSFRGVW